MPRLVGTLLLVVACVLFGLRSIGAQQDAAKVDIQRLGPQVGEQAPDFQLQDQFGRTWTRDSIMGPQGAMLVFFRSADW
jgi:cytochrome oxidase Cu insertion factor (SCO1/SenC/PrrC family)